MVDMKGGVEMVIGFLVIGILAASLIPEAVDEITNVSTSSWGNIETTLWNLTPMAIVLGGFLYFIGAATDFI